MRLTDLVTTSRAVASTAGRLEKIAHLADLLSRTPPDEVAIVVGFLTGEPRQGRLGVGFAQVSALRDVPHADAPTLDVRDVDAVFDRLLVTSGPGSADARAQMLRQLLGRATEDEQDFLARLLFGELRQGALEGVLMDAIARATNIPA